MVGISAASVTLRSGAEQTGTLVVSIAGGTASALFFIQQQKLAEMNLFKQLILEFTQRYDRMNGDLAAIRRENRFRTDADQQIVLDYFNLCAEEYLFYSEGYIAHRVWRSWSRGMLQYFEVAPFGALWAEEGASESYYGLTLAEIKRGAA